MDNGIEEKSDYKEPSPADPGIDDAEKANGDSSSTSDSEHPQETLRHFGLLSLIGIATVTGNAWSGIGGSIVVAIYNGGPPGVIYEFIVVCIAYCFVSASIAELASAMPSSGGVYYFASVCGGKKYGRVAGWFAGWWNFFTWIFALSSVCSIVGNQILSMWGLFRPDFEPKSWHVFVCYILIAWICCFVVLFLNRILPLIEHLSLYLVVGGVFVTVLVCAIMPKVNGQPYASNDFVWKDWNNQTGWTSNGFVFVAGMLNGTFGIGYPDLITHVAEEMPNPSVNLPKTIFYQILIGFLTTFCFLISIFYAVNDLDAVLNASTSFPLTVVYRQATGSAGGSLGLVLVLNFGAIATVIGCYITAGRTFWVLARDNATPFSKVFGKIDPKHKNPFNATILCGCCASLLACIYVGSTTAFNAFVGSFAICSMLSYLAAIIPHVLRKRKSVEPGAFWMKGWIGWFVNIVSCVYMIVFIIIFCFPITMPVSAANMNYAVLIVGGLSIFVAVWWFVKRGQYEGPKRLPKEVRD